MSLHCTLCASAFDRSPLEENLRAKLAPMFAGQRCPLPPPRLCPDCRQQRRLFWRNERSLYRRTCSLCHTSMISMYPATSSFPVYCTECWWSDRWDPLNFGRDVDFSRPFFPQLKDLQNVVPRLALNVVNNQNSEFVNHSGSNKDCYLLFAAEFNEDCLYGYQVIKSIGCVDASDCTESQYCYEVSDVNKCYDILFSQQCTNCSAGAFLYDCIGCRDCLFCVNLRSKQYCVRNEQLSKDDYAREKAQLLLRLARGETEQVRQEFTSFLRGFPRRAAEIINCEHATGNYLKNSKNVHHCFELSYAEDCAFVYTGFQTRDLLDVTHTTDAQLGYDSLSLGYGSYNALFTHGSWSGKNVLYCDIVQTGSDMFGCVCTKPARHCILNKQYSPSEYESVALSLTEHMRKTGEWGEFFPAGIAPFAYNETTAQQYFPFTREEVQARGWTWRDEPEEIPKTVKLIPGSQLPAAIADIPDDILNWAIECDATKRPFKIMKKELEFYRSHGLSIPRLHPDERHRRRMAMRTPRMLWTRTCSKCKASIQTSYAPNRPEKIYCENCYHQELF